MRIGDGTTINYNLDYQLMNLKDASANHLLHSLRELFVINVNNVSMMPMLCIVLTVHSLLLSSKAKKQLNSMTNTAVSHNLKARDSTEIGIKADSVRYKSKNYRISKQYSPACKISRA